MTRKSARRRWGKEEEEEEEEGGENPHASRLYESPWARSELRLMPGTPVTRAVTR